MKIANQKSIYELAELGGIYMRLGRTQTGMSSYRSPYVSWLSFHAFTGTQLRPVWLHFGRWPDTIFFRSGLRPYSSHDKTKNESQTGSINSMFLRMAPPFLLFLSKNRNTATNNITKQDLEVASMLRLMWARDWTILRRCAVDTELLPPKRGFSGLIIILHYL